MNIRRIVPDIYSKNPEESINFYVEFIGLKLSMDMGWILTFISVSNPTAQVNIIQSDKPDIDNSHFTISIEVADVKKLYDKALSENMEIVHQLTDEAWGVRRFFVKDPNGVTVNIMCHIKDVKE
ncbi:MAG: VOC family protein [Calditrichaeota bacterium]|nr:VOC family protein [Calditrichota bacterium]